MAMTAIRVVLAILVGLVIALVAANSFRAPRSWRKYLMHALAVGAVLALSAVALPNFVKARSSTPHYVCVGHLKEISGAKATWALEFKKQATDIPQDADIFGPTNYIREKRVCPAGGIYQLCAVGKNPTCSKGGVGHRLEE